LQEAIGRITNSASIDALLDRLPDEAGLIEKKLREQQILSESSDLSLMFKNFDADKDGRISEEELKEMM
jgi:Ca2+-binding EF-hand superfamily protein